MYEVGDVLYVISNKRRNVVPVQVVEQIVRRTAAGEEVTFKVSLPVAAAGKEKEPQKPVDLHSIQGTVHRSLDDVRVVLYEQASSAINDLLNAAHKVASSKFGEAAVSLSRQKQNAQKKIEEQRAHQEELIEEPLSYYETPPEAVPEKQSPKMLDMDVLSPVETTALSVDDNSIAASVLDFTGATDPGEVKIQLPDGSYAKVKSDI